MSKLIQEALETGLAEIKAYYGADTFGIVAMEVIDKVLNLLKSGKLVVVDGADLEWLLKSIEIEAGCTGCPVRKKILSCAKFNTCADAFRAYLQGSDDEKGKNNEQTKKNNN